jgi:transposase-like protein
MVAAVFRTIFAQPDAATAAATWDHVRAHLAGRFPKIGCAEGPRGRGEVLAFIVFPRRAPVEDLEHQPVGAG